MFCKTKIPWREYRCEIQNGTLFIKKLEPIKLFTTIFGMRSYKMTGKYFTKVGVWTKLQIICLCVISSITIGKIFQEFIEILDIDLFFLATFSIYLAGLVNILTYWISNINSTCIIRIFKNFDYVELLIPGVNGYLHNGNHLSIFFHCTNFFLLIIGTMDNFYNYSTKTRSVLEFQNMLAIGVIIYSLAAGFSFLQVCVLINIISSYVNVLNFLLCREHGKLEYHYENNDAFMFLLKNNILRHAEINPSRISPQLEIASVIQMYSKLLQNIEITNHKYNVLVSNIHKQIS